MIIIPMDVSVWGISVCLCEVHMVKHSAGLLLVTLPRLKLN